MKESELILNPDGSIYHLALLPGDIASTVILVGDQDRVALVSGHFDFIEIKKQKREFVTHTGIKNGKRISVISTGIGTDNIDIVVNELDALCNIDFHSRKVNEDIRQLDLIRIGTSGSIHPDIHLHDLLISEYAIGTDALGQYYGVHQRLHHALPPWSYMSKAGYFNLANFGAACKKGITLTCPGFYAAQGRTLRLDAEYKMDIHALSGIHFHSLPLCNIEMETAGIYLMAEKLGHNAISFNTILAERLNGSFSKNLKILDDHIDQIVNWISTLP